MVSASAREEELPSRATTWCGMWRARASSWCGPVRAGSPAHYNVCRHRGSQLVPDVRRPAASPAASAAPTTPGPTPSTARSAPRPFLEESRRARHGRPLAPSGRASTPGAGSSSCNLRPEEARRRGARLPAQLGGVPERLRRYPLAELRVARRIEYAVAANWKVMLENYNECYHCGPVHPELCRLVPAFKQRGGSELDWERGIPHRDGAWTFTDSGTTTRAPFAGLERGRARPPQGRADLSQLPAEPLGRARGAFTGLPARARPDHRWSASSSSIPPRWRRPDFDPSDAVEFWDLVNRQDWAICESVQRGMTLAGVPDRLLRADGELEPGHPALRGRAARRSRPVIRRDFEYIVLGLGGFGSAAAYWLARRAGADVLGLEQFELGHVRGESQDHSRIIRLSYHTPGYVELAKHAYQAWARAGARGGRAGRAEDRRARPRTAGERHSAQQLQRQHGRGGRAVRAAGCGRDHAPLAAVAPHATTSTGCSRSTAASRWRRGATRPTCAWRASTAPPCANERRSNRSDPTTARSRSRAGGCDLPLPAARGHRRRLVQPRPAHRRDRAAASGDQGAGHLFRLASS